MRLPLKVIAVSWRDLLQTSLPIVIVSALAVYLAVHFVRPAPPHVLIISSGPEGSLFGTYAERYRTILGQNGITLRILPSHGSQENLSRVASRFSAVDVGLVQSGISVDGDTSGVMSLGSVAYQPMVIFYRARAPLLRLSQLRGERIAIGPEGSGTRTLALALLKANEIEPGGPSTLLDLEGEAARGALLKGQTDAIFLTGDSAAPATMRELLHTAGIQLFDFQQADAYAKRFPYLHKLPIPAGAFDLGENLPPTPINLLAPTVDLLARADLHPALVDLLIEAARRVNGGASLLQAAGEFPTPAEHAFPVSPEAERYYKSGRTFTYRYLPFWLASLLNRALVIMVPVFVVVIPGLRYLPQLYSWRIRVRIYRRYGELMALEREALKDPEMPAERRAALLERVDHIERSVIRVKMPGSHAEMLYDLREHLNFVRDRLSRTSVGPVAERPEAAAVAE